MQSIKLRDNWQKTNRGNYQLFKGTQYNGDLKSDHLKSGLNEGQISKGQALALAKNQTIQKSGHFVQISNGLKKWWPSVQILNGWVFGFQIPFEIKTFAIKIFATQPLLHHTKSRIDWISNGWKVVGLQMFWISNGIWNPEAQPFETQINGSHLVKNHLISHLQKSLDFWMVWFQIPTVLHYQLAKTANLAWE